MTFKKKAGFTVAIIMSALIMVTGCFLDQEEDTELTFADNVVVVEDDITTPTTWDSSRVYYIGFDMSVTSSLVIPAGTVIKFGAAGGISVTGSGTVTANGTDLSPIIFTSVKDDSFGGDSTLDGASTPAAGNWQQIGFGENTSGSTFNYCRFYYGGGYIHFPSVIWLFNASATITNSIFAFNKGQASASDGYIGTVDANSARTGTIITGNRFFGNVVSLSINAALSLDDSNYFSSVENNPATGLPYTNTFNGIFVDTGNGIDTVTWRETEVAYVLTESGTNRVNAGEALTLGNGVVLKFMDGAHLEFDNDLGAAISYTTGNVDFTSYKDDDLLGDANGNGSANQPDVINGNWDGIWHWNASSEWERTFESDCHYLLP